MSTFTLHMVKVLLKISFLFAWGFLSAKLALSVYLYSVWFVNVEVGMPAVFTSLLEDCLQCSSSLWYIASFVTCGKKIIALVKQLYFRHCSCLSLFNIRNKSQTQSWKCVTEEPQKVEVAYKGYQPQGQLSSCVESTICEGADWGREMEDMSL